MDSAVGFTLHRCVELSMQVHQTFLQLSYLHSQAIDHLPLRKTNHVEAFQSSSNGKLVVHIRFCEAGIILHFWSYFPFQDVILSILNQA